MENKYYTPSIEEFFVGFEFERRNLLDRRKWVECTFKDGECAEQYCNEEEGRVKYLDSSDIEELGFKLVFSDIGIECWKLGDFELRTDVDLGAYIDSDNLYSIFYNPYGKQYNCVFSGIIKNKSEFRKVLNMLNIK